MADKLVSFLLIPLMVCSSSYVSSVHKDKGKISVSSLVQFLYGSSYLYVLPSQGK